VYYLFVFDLDGECKFIKTKHYSDSRNRLAYVLLSCHLGRMNRRRFGLQKGGSQEHISLITHDNSIYRASGASRGENTIIYSKMQ